MRPGFLQTIALCGQQTILWYRGSAQRQQDDQLWGKHIYRKARDGHQEYLNFPSPLASFASFAVSRFCLIATQAER